VTFVDWEDLHKWALINRALEFGQPEPTETYSSSAHLYTDLDIPEGVRGRLKSTPPTKGVEREPRNDKSGAKSGGSRDGRRTNNPKTHVSGEHGVAAGAHDGGGAQHHDGNNPSRTRSRNRRRGPGLSGGASA
jgi:hypothetical protein